MVEDICTHVLILDAGEQRFFGPFAQLHVEFGEDSAATSLEDIFFRAITRTNERSATGEATAEAVAADDAADSLAV
jgi:ABC-type multidrug transport system ATPase subunit